MAAKSNRMTIDLLSQIAPASPQVSWKEKNPEVYELMRITGFTQYQIASICGMYEGSLGKKLRRGLTREESDRIVDTVCAYILRHVKGPAHVSHMIMPTDTDGKYREGALIWMITENLI